ncbi:MAG TPA: hypothetical protein VFQ35_25540 [Polyangiaceae bacterium]|nr:hypothetical protein [Polyangiaceae bacterium]
MDTAPAVCAHEAPAASDYLDRLMRRNSFEALWPLFAKAQRPAKELTESYSALVHLRPFLQKREGCRVVHVGDGAHARTAAMFSLKSKTYNISVDPELNLALVDDWRQRFGVERFERRRARIEDVAQELNTSSDVPTFVTFVHAHVEVEQVLARLRWDAAFVLACCVPGKQLCRSHVRFEGEDMNVLSLGRRYQVLVNESRSR